MSAVLLSLLRLLLFLLSSIGWWELFRRRFRIPPFFLPAFTVSVQLLAVFLAGIAGLLLPSVLFLFAGGLLLLCFFLIRSGRKVFLPYRRPGFFLFALFLLLAVLAVRGTRITYWDDFAHWALVVQEMLYSNAFPSSDMILIVFKDYPPGSASFLYYFCRIVDDSEPMMMLGQTYLMTAFLLPVFELAEGTGTMRRQIPICLFLGLFWNLLLVFFSNIHQLLVDTLVPLCGSCGLFFLLFRCLPRTDSRESLLSPLCAVPFLACTVLIKYSGLYFAALGMMLLLISCIRKQIRPVPALTAAGLPLVFLLLWKLYCISAFPDSSLSKHALSAANYQSILAEKSTEDFLLTARNFLRLSFRGWDLWTVLLFLLLLYILSGWFRKKKKPAAKLLLVSLGLYASYMLFTLLMYFFSMPNSEAVRLASFYRYRGSILIAICYLMMLQSAFLLSAASRGTIFFRTAAVLLACLILMWRLGTGSFPTIFLIDRENTQIRFSLDQACSDYDLGHGERVLICNGTIRSSEYLYYMAKYVLKSYLVDVVLEQDILRNPDLSGYGEIVLLGTFSPELDSWILEHYPEQNGQAVIRLG